MFSMFLDYTTYVTKSIDLLEKKYVMNDRRYDALAHPIDTASMATPHSVVLVKKYVKK